MLKSYTPNWFFTALLDNHINQLVARYSCLRALPADISHDTLEKLIFPPKDTSASELVMPDMLYFDTEMRKPGVTRQLLWMEYKADALSTICCVIIGITLSFRYPARANNIRHMLQSMKTCVVLATTTDRRNNRMSDNLLNKLTQLKLPAMAGSLIRQRETPQTYDELSFEERLTLLVDDELLSRENSRVARLRKNACLKYQATPEGLRYPASRGLRAEQMRELLNGHYIIHRKNLLITGPTGCGKSWIANALGEQACRQKYSVRYCRTGRLLEQLAQ